MKRTTICFLIKGDDIVLAEKKEGFGAGYFNGYGGKIEEGETVEDTAIREVLEEGNVSIVKESLQKVAIIDFYELDRYVTECHIFFASAWEGEILETKEMGRGQFFPMNGLPFDRMWGADKVWLPDVCKGERFRAKFRYKEGMKEIEGYEKSPL